jgi:hypothetical protein
MKNINIMTTTMMIWALALIFNLNTATAAENRTVFEMGESGQTVSFPVTATEISAADAEDKKPVTLKNRSPFVRQIREIPAPPCLYMRWGRADIGFPFL